MDVPSPLVAHQESTVLRQPRQRALHHQSVPPQPLAGVFSSPSYAALDAAAAQNPSTAPEVVGLICVELLGSLAWPALSRTLDRFDGVHQILEDLRIVDIGGGEHHGEGNAVAIGQEVVLRARLTSVGEIGADRFAPLLAGTLAGSKHALDQSTLPSLPSQSRSARCRRRQTPAFCQSRSRRQHVTPLPKPSSLGGIRQGMPLLGTLE
jgi:hypothetical protein